MVAEKAVEEKIESMVVDEDGFLKIRGEKDTDHNTIILTMKIEGAARVRTEKKTRWRLNAPEESWTKFRHELDKLESDINKIFNSRNDSMDKQYAKWLKSIECAARKSIGRTTIKPVKGEKFLNMVKSLRSEKKEKSRSD